MALLPIVIYPHPVLREPAQPVEKITDEIRQLLDDMAETMYAAPGIGLAAPQVGRSIRAIVVDVDFDSDDAATSRNLLKIINPEIIAESEDIVEGEEGCLSLPGIRENVERAAEITIRGLDSDGKEFELEASGLLAICLQHEIDHLDGILIFDRISRLKRQLALAKLKKRSE